MTNPPPLLGLTLLIVEDDAWILADLKSMLSRNGADVMTADTLAAATFQSSASVDAAILDIRLGDDVVTPVASDLHDKNVPLVFHSAVAEKELLAATFPGARVLSKPASETSLVKTVTEVVKGA